VKRTSIAIVALVTLSLAAPFGAVPQQSRTMRHIGVLGTLEGPISDAFRQGLREFGYVEGQNLVIDYGPIRGGAEEFATKAADLVRLKVEVIYTVGPAALAAAAKATRRIPIVAVDMISDPLASGFARSLSRPGGNITGVFLDLPDFMGKWVELLRESVPGLSRVAVLWDPSSGPFQMNAVTGAGRAQGLRLQTLEVQHSDAFERAFAAARQARAEAAILLPSPLTYYNPRRLAELAAKDRLPAISLYSEFPAAGGLISYGPGGRFIDINRSNGARVGKILDGAKPGDLPIERPSKFELVINLKTAKALGLTIPQSVLVRADEVIK